MSSSRQRSRNRLTQRTNVDMKEAESTAHSIISSLSAVDAARILEKIRSNTDRVFDTTKNCQQCKFETLSCEKQASKPSTDTYYVIKSNCVKYLSASPLTNVEVSLLKRSFAVTSTNIPATEIIGKNTQCGTSKHCEKNC